MERSAKVIDNKHQACYRRDANGTNSPRIIAENLLDDHSSLYSLSLVSKTLQKERQPLLYRIVVHNPCHGRGPPVKTFTKIPGP